MTGPIQDRADDLVDRIGALSDDTEQAVTGPLAAELEQTQRALLARWVRDFGSIADGPADRGDAARFADAARRRLTEAMNPDLVDRDAFTAADALAYDLGVLDASEMAPEDRLRLPERPDRGLVDLTSAVDDELAQAILGLSEDAVEDQQFDAVTEAMRRAGRSVTRIRATVAYEVTAAVSEGVRAVAQASGMNLVWVSERDGCLTCLAYAGATAPVGGVFPTGLTFDTRPMSAPPDLLAGPPRHPHCRCVLQLWDPADEAVVTALKRESKRSVLRGWAHEGESTPARLRAAERLLVSGSGMPKSVEAAARRALKQGRFPEDRPFE